MHTGPLILLLAYTASGAITAAYAHTARRHARRAEHAARVAEHAATRPPDDTAREHPEH